MKPTKKLTTKLSTKLSEGRLLEFFREEARGPMSFKELSVRLGVPRDGKEMLKGLLKELINEGTLVKLRGARYGLSARMNLITGDIICHADGYGFVEPIDEREKKLGDIFIRRGSLKGAMHGDRVVARVNKVEGIKTDKRRSGDIVRILKRKHRTLVGHFVKRGITTLVVPAEERLLTEILISPGSSGKAQDGDMVVVEITRWPEKRTPPLGLVKEVLGRADDPTVEIEVIARKYGLPFDFPAEVLGETRQVPAEVDPEDIEGRTDLRGKTFFTIDGETAKDFDDAICIESSSTGNGFKLLVSIADVAHYVRESSATDTEAYERGTSVYFPDKCVPMLPEALSNGICSLNPGVDRLTLTAELDFDGLGALKKKKLYESVINSKERLTYTTVKRLLEGEDEPLSKRYSHVTSDLRAMETLASLLFKKRAEAGSIDFDLPEPQIIIDLEGNIEDIVRSERNVAHRIIEEFMLSANRAVASEFERREWPFIYRVHDEPDPDSIAEFREFTAGFGYSLKKGRDSGQTKKAEKITQVTKVTGPKTMQRALKHFEGGPYERLVNHVLLRAMKQAQYSDENRGHFGLAFDTYTHFTSPIRRYPDLIVHRLLKKLIKKTFNAPERERAASELGTAATHCSARERTAMEAEREIVDLKKAQFMQDKTGEVFEGLVSGVTGFGIFVELKEYFVEGLVHVTTLGNEYYEFREKEHSLVGATTGRTFTPGTEVTVRVAEVDIERRRIDLVLAEEDLNKGRGVKRVSSGAKKTGARTGSKRAGSKGAGGKKTAGKKAAPGKTGAKKSGNKKAGSKNAPARKGASGKTGKSGKSKRHRGRR